MLPNIDLLAVDDVQSLLQGADSLALEVVDAACLLWPLTPCLFNSRRLCFELASESLLAILHCDGVAACGVGSDVDVEAHDAACIDGFLIDGLARLVCNAYLIGIVERVETNPQ